VTATGVRTAEPATGGPAVGQLPAPAALAAAHPLPPELAAAVDGHRTAIRRILDSADDRLLVVIGPCSIHDPAAGLDYAGRLAAVADRHRADLLVIMRAYLEKPRSAGGWKGLVPNPDLDGRGDLAHGLVLGRRFLLDAAATGLPLAYEFVEPLVASYLADTVSWAAIGARTVTSQPHRHLAAWLPMPVGCKNSIDGDVGAAVAAVRVAAASHRFPGVGVAGEPAVLHAGGNPWAHVVLRGGASGPNYQPAAVAASLAALHRASLPARVVVDASHGNSGKDHRRQPAVIAALAAQVAGGRPGLVGVMVESFLTAGRQDQPERYGMSITDGCIGWGQTEAALDTLAAAVRERRGTGRG
jgi:3-deoxy-7-phosphoheptulonate synthase